MRVCVAAALEFKFMTERAPVFNYSRLFPESPLETVTPITAAAAAAVAAAGAIGSAESQQ